MEDQNLSVVVPSLLGPIFRKRHVNLRQTLSDNATNRKLKLLTTFIPDELIFLIERNAKLVHHDFVIVLYIEYSNLSLFYEEFCNINNNESCEFAKMCNSLTSQIVEHICLLEGDVIKLSDNGILSVWHQHNELVHELMRRVISCCFTIKEFVQDLKSEFQNLFQISIKCVISAGGITFSMIGDLDVLNYVIIGKPLTSLQRAIEIGKPQDIILAASAWEHCTLSDYGYVILDKSHIKIIRDTKKCTEVDGACKIDDFKTSTISLDAEKDSKVHFTDSSSDVSSVHLNKIRIIKNPNIDLYNVVEGDLGLESNRPALTGLNIGIFLRNFVVDTIVKQYVNNLKCFLGPCNFVLSRLPKLTASNRFTFNIFSFYMEIDNDRSFEHITELKNVTVVLIEITSMKSEADDLIPLTDDCHKIILESCENVGCIEDISLRGASVVFRIVFGIRSYLKDLNHCQFGVLAAWNLLHALERVTHVSAVSVGVSTGISCVTVIGHYTRQQYTVIGAPIIKSENMVRIEKNKVVCDLDTVMHSDISKSYFLSRGLVNLRRHKKDYMFHYTHRNEFEDRTMTELKDAYPILDRFDELELFSEILDDIGIPNREYAGILIEGKNRMGKSRTLDGFVTLAKARQMAVVKIVLHPTFAYKPYAVIYKILEQILEAEWCKTIDELERNVVRKLGHALLPEELCYMNRILRVRFKHSKQYLMDSDWDRHKKSLGILDKILDLNNEKRCILLDNVEYMDYMSWQFLAQAISHANIILAMTILEAKSWDELSRVETDICRDKRLLRHSLAGLPARSISPLACQFLGVHAVAVELHDFLLHSKTNYPGWVELFLSLMTLCGAINIVNLTPNEAAEKNLIFPDMIQTTRISTDLMPEETAPPQPWDKREKVTVCLVNDKFEIAETFTDYSLRELSMEIYSRLSIYEQNIVRYASLIGKVFLRDMLEMIIPNHQSLKTSAAIENLIRIRLFECALLQRQSANVGDLAVCSFKPRSTFSDMHHLLRCRCHLQSIPQTEKHLPRYSQCRFMEFKVSIFQRISREQFYDFEKRECHTLLAEIYKKEAHKCLACGGGPFLILPGTEKFRKPMKTPIPVLDAYKTEQQQQQQPIEDRVVEEQPRVVDKRIKNREVCFVDEAKDGGETGRRISILPSSIENDDVEVCCVTPETARSSKKMRKKSKIHPVVDEEVDQSLPLDNFGHVDSRYCRCLSIINCVFLKLQQHIKYIDNNEKIIDFMMEYATALIDYGQPGFALRFLALADERNDYVGTYDAWKNPALYGKMLKKSMILRLRGNAYMLLGNYPQAKTNYVGALSLFKNNFSTSEWFTRHKAMYEKIKQNIRWNFTYPTTRTEDKQERAAVIAQNTAACLRLVSSTLAITRQHKAAKLACLQSVVFGFSNYNSSNFYEQCELYLSIVKIYGKLGDLSFASCVEKYVLFAINQKQKWNHSDEIAMVARVYAAIFKVSLLRGKMDRAATFGEKALRICKYFHMIRLEFEILPPLIQTLMRLKRVCATVDMLQRLRDNALGDIDKSALTWYYALCMDLTLDAGIVIESYEVCAEYAREITAVDSKVCILRDPTSTKRLITGLWSWQLRKSDLTTSTFVKSLDFFVADIEVDNYSQVITLCKVLECHLLLLTRCVNFKKGRKMEMLLAEIAILMKILNDVANMVDCVKPHYYLLKAYFHLVRGHTFSSMSMWRRAKKCAEVQKNVMALARADRNRNTWKAITSFNTMARYWEENIGYRNMIVWQDVDVFDIDEWSNMMFSLPVPDSYI